MGDPVSPVKAGGLNAQETLGFRLIVPLGVVEHVNLIRDRSIPLQPDPVKYRLPPVKGKNNDYAHSNKQALAITAIAMEKTYKNKNVLDELVQLGFVDLAEKLKNKIGPPWDDILQIGHPLIIEQLYDLATLLEIKKSAGIECSSSLIETGLQLGREAAIAPSALIGKLIYVLDSDPHRLNCHARDQEKEFHAWIEKRFTKCIEETKTELHNYQKKQRIAGLQDSEIAYHNQLPIEIANFTLSSTGCFNIGLAEDMIEAFTNKALSSHNYPSHLIHSLRELAAVPLLREKLSRILKPSSEEAPANVVIRTTLDLLPTHAITDLEAKKTALSALLTFLRQGSDGSCFATPLAISLLNHHLDKCLDDFSHLLKCSKLTRQVGSESYDFPFILRIGDQSLLKSIRITRTGKLVLPNGKLIRLSKVPGVIAVMKALGLEKVKVVRTLFQNCKKEEMFVEISIKQMLQALVRQGRDLPFNQSKSLADLYLHGCFAFAAQECNPLVEMWGNAIAGMAEADGQSMVRSAIIASLTKVLGRAVNKTFENDLEFGTLLTKHLIMIFNQKIHLQWDPHIAYSDLSADQHSTEGAFVLYDKGSYSKPSRWLRVDNPESFQAFVLRVLDEAKKELKRSDAKVNWTAKREPFQKLELYIESLQFSKDAINDYYPLNAEKEHLLNHFQELAYTPWVTKSGNSLNKVIQIYLENPELKAFHQLVPTNAEELLSQLIILVRSLPKDLKQKLISQPNYCLPIRIPYLHAFSIIFGHPTFRSSWMEEIPPAEWIETRLIAPGLAISESTLPSESRQQIISSITNTFIHSQNSYEFNRAIHNLPEIISITHFRQALLEIIIKLESDETLLPNLIASFLDGAIYQSLPENLKEQLAQSAVHIADSNWARGKHGINFCLVVNPGTGKIEMWVANDDYSRLFPLDQAAWFNHGGWEFFNI